MASVSLETRDPRTEPIPPTPSFGRVEDAADGAFQYGLPWLAAHALPDPSAPEYLPLLLGVYRLDLSRAADPAARAAEYRRLFPSLNRIDPPTPRSTPKASSPRLRALASPPPDITEQTPAPVLVELSGVVQRSSPTVRDVPFLAPDVASELGFTDLTQLGQGGFGTVYMARQPSVGSRLVVIKYTTARSREPQVLAALQHPNIMPVWSVHEHAGHRVFCMPLHGRSTLADVLKMIDRTKSLPVTGAGFLSAAVLPPEVVLPLADDLPEEMELGSEADRKRLAKQGYVEAVVAGVAKLSDALAHAHRRRVVHLDMKPANILVTDDGAFMILDFGLAYQNGIAASTEAGGTVRYMSPEQLTEFVAGRGVRPDPRMDLYALGLVFYELLTGLHPFADSMVPGKRREEWVAARHRSPPKLRRLNPAVPPGIEAIVLKLLHPDKSARYQSAEHLHTDLTRHQAHQPLVHARNPSWRELFGKYRRRHPVASVAAMAVVLAGFALAGFGVATVEADRARKQAIAVETGAAERTLADLRADQTAVRIDAASVQSPDARAQAINTVKKWRVRYAVDAPDWAARPDVARLKEADRQALELALVEFALLAAHAERLNANGQPTGMRAAALERAADWNLRAEAVGGAMPVVMGEQRAMLAKLLARPLPPPVGQPADESAIDLYLRGLDRLADRKPRAARELFIALEKLDPQHAANRFALAYTYHLLGNMTKAVERYQVAMALAPTDARPAYNRGVLLLQNQLNVEAIADFNTALLRDPTLADGYFYRAHARLMQMPGIDRPAELQQKRDEILADLSRALELTGPRYRYTLLRLNAYTHCGDAAAAAAARRDLDATPPTDELDYLTRAGLRQGADPHAAIADLSAAAELNPVATTTWRSLAGVQASVGRNADAIASLRIALALQPEDTLTRLQTAVLIARNGDRDTAIELVEDLQPATVEEWYQRAAVYALNAHTHLSDRGEALRGLAVAYRGQFDDSRLLNDPDFRHVIDQVAFVELMRTKGKVAD